MCHTAKQVVFDHSSCSLVRDRSAVTVTVYWRLKQVWPPGSADTVCPRLPLVTQVQHFVFVQWLGVELCKLSLQASKIHFCIHKKQSIPGYWHILDFLKKWPLPKPFWIAIKNVSRHLRYLDKIEFANRLWPSEGSDINRYETGSSVQPSRPPSWEMDMTSYVRSGCFDFLQNSVAWCRIMCRFLENGRNRNRKYIFNMTDVCFSKTEVVIFQPSIEICRQNLVCW